MDGCDDLQKVVAQSYADSEVCTAGHCLHSAAALQIAVLPILHYLNFSKASTHTSTRVPHEQN
jgi:hypothetical protein